MPLSVLKLTLSNFRNYEARRFTFGSGGLHALVGENGVGKTNVLEAISLLSPGKGLRGADLLDIKNRSAAPEDTWGVSADIEDRAGVTTRVGTGLDLLQKRRVVRIDGKDAPRQNDLAERFSVLWLTPQMDRLFLDGASSRRKFVDRLVYTAIPDHATRVNRYDKNLRERLSLLQAGVSPDTRWLDTLEQQIAADAVAMTVARRDVTERLNAYAGELHHHARTFPRPHVSMQGAVDLLVAEKTAIAAETLLQEILRENRRLDAETGRTTVGAHRSDMVAIHSEKNMPAAQSSTGEQKALLVSIVLAHARMTAGDKGFVPVLLLDEVAAHFDAIRRAALFDCLHQLGGQILMTGTDRDIFKAVAGDPQIVSLD